MYPIPSEVAFGDDSLPLVLIAAVLGFFLAALETAKLNLEFTEVRASDDGYVTNLNLRIGGQAVANQPVLALVDAASFWVHRYFRETRVGRARPGDQAVITLMTFPDNALLLITKADLLLTINRKDEGLWPGFKGFQKDYTQCH